MRINARLVPGKVALITGGSSGIGKAIACGLAERGLHVWLLAQRQEILDAAQAEVEAHRQNQGQLISTVSADVSDLGQVKLAVQQILDRSGLPDLLVNSAGVSHPGYVQELDNEIFRWMMSVNYFGTVYVTQELLPAMIKRGSGYIVNLSSLAGVFSVIGYSAYGPSKFAVRGFSDALRQEMRLYGIGVSLILPSDTATPQLDYENQFKPAETKALGNISGSMTADDVARIILKGIERGRYLIIPALEARIIYHLNGFLGMGLNPIIDLLIADARKKAQLNPQKEA